MEILDDESDVEDSSVGDEAHPHTGDGDGGYHNDKPQLVSEVTTRYIADLS